MGSLYRSAGYAAAVIFLAFLVHNVNALYVEPTTLASRIPRWTTRMWTS